MGDQLNNAYFEQRLAHLYGNMTEDELIQRISDCQFVTERLDSDPVWKMVISDAQKWVDRIDANWQEIEDDKQRNYARVLKFAYLHIKDLPNKYKADLENAKVTLDQRKNISKKIVKDYDQETITE